MKKEEFIKNIKFWDWKAYRNTFKVKLDRIHANDNDSQDFLLKHVLDHGIKENRKIIIDKNNKHQISRKTIEKNFHLLLPSDFNWKKYIDLHKDLKKINETGAKCHYIIYGNYEGRSYSYEIISKNNFINNLSTKNLIYKNEFYIISFLDMNYINVFEVWYKFYQELNINKKLIICCLDNKSYSYFESKTFNNVIHIKNILPSNSLQTLWILRCETFHYLVNKLNISILHTDFDCIWFKNLFLYHFNEKHLKKYDVISSVGTIFPLEMSQSNHFVLCMGLIYFNNSNNSKLLLDKIKMDVYNSKDDQVSINMICKNFKFNYPKEYYENTVDNKIYREYKKCIVCSNPYNILVLPHHSYLRNQNSNNFNYNNLITFHPLLKKTKEDKLSILNYENLNNKLTSNKSVKYYIFYHNEKTLNENFDLFDNSNFETINLNEIKLKTDLIDNNLNYTYLSLNEYNGLLDINSESEFIGCFTYSIPKKYSDNWAKLTGHKMFSENKFKFRDLINKKLNFNSNYIYCIEIKKIEKIYNNILNKLHESKLGVNNKNKIKFPIIGPVKSSFIMSKEIFNEFQTWYKKAINWYIKHKELHIGLDENNINCLGKTDEEIKIAKIRYNYGYIFERFQSYYFYQKYRDNLVKLQNFCKI